MDDNQINSALLALFLPVLTGQAGHTVCQALAVTLRGIAFGELRTGRDRALFLRLANVFVC